MRSKTIVVSCNAEKISPMLVRRVEKIAEKMGVDTMTAARILLCRAVGINA